MGRWKDLCMDALEAEMTAYMEAHPEADEQEAYENTDFAKIEARAADKLATAEDWYRGLRDEGIL